jgi:hypothetical protein
MNSFNTIGNNGSTSINKIKLNPIGGNGKGGYPYGWGLNNNLYKYKWKFM